MPVGACLSEALLAPCAGGRQVKPSELPWEADGRQVGPGLEVSLASCLSLLSQALCDQTHLLPILCTPGSPMLSAYLLSRASDTQVSFPGMSLSPSCCADLSVRPQLEPHSSLLINGIAHPTLFYSECRQLTGSSATI